MRSFTVKYYSHIMLNLAKNLRLEIKSSGKFIILSLFNRPTAFWGLLGPRKDVTVDLTHLYISPSSCLGSQETPIYGFRVKLMSYKR